MAFSLPTVAVHNAHPGLHLPSTITSQERAMCMPLYVLIYIPGSCVSLRRICFYGVFYGVTAD